MKPYLAQPLFILAYYRKMMRLFGSSLVACWPLWEVAGSTAADISGNGRNGSYTNAVLADSRGPFGRSAAYFGGNAYANVQGASLAAAFSGAEGTVALLARVPEAVPLDLNYRVFFRLQADTNNRVQIEKSGTNRDAIIFTYRAASTFYLVTAEYIASQWAGWMHYAITWSRSNNRMRAYINGVQSGADQAITTDWAGSLTTSLLGAAGTAPLNPLDGWLQYVTVGNTELPATSIAAMAGIPRRGVIWEGDSRTTGSGATNQAYSYPCVAARKLAGSWRCANIGTSGQSLATMITQIPGEIAPKAGNYHVAVLWGGVNDNTDAATMHSRILSWCTSVRLLGFKVVVCTEIDCQAASHSEWHNSNYPALNALIRANFSGYADGLADLGAQSELQDATNLTYFNADRTHLTDAGYAIVAQVVAAAIAAL